ncbi:MAG: oligopeptide/dipeptide ABC transporter ATP-binding protein [Nitrososphaerales archaeon]
MSQVRLESNLSQRGRMPLLRVKNLAVYFRNETATMFEKKSTIRAVDNVSFDVFESETVSLVGESGSGKSTIARALSLLQKPDAGSIEFNGVDITKLHRKSLKDYHRDVQMIFQDPFESFNPRDTVLSAISAPLRRLMGMKDRAELTESVSKLLDEVGMEPEIMINRYPHELSGGERQRVSIARALASQPKLLIADEPITMLDAAQRLNVLSLLDKLRAKRNLTLLMITHDLASARVLSNRILVIYLGKLVEVGDTRSVLSKPHHPYIELITDAIPRIHESRNDREEESINSIEESMRVTQGCPFRPRCKYATEICSNVEPPLEEKTAVHYAACHNPLNM